MSPPSDALLIRLTQAFALLRSIEWSARRGEWACCPVCYCYPKDNSPDGTRKGHAPDCELNRLLTSP